MEALETIATSPLPTILAIFGSIFLILALAGGVGGKFIIEIPPDRQKGFMIAGVVLFIAGAFVYALPFLISRLLEVPTPTPPRP
jgi:drug/metabolite transporter (DMT)-like permease